ncbi:MULTISPECIES: THUMP domain-containing class I SAM-dependent RNA methyltransferase [Pontibacillus]|uniref:Class I SAM-dependent RNA methyltransferase n=1 Tax=Pontibacillus chungwhensis TaxID=265426 RepID=A0ABY8US60_9BACI|nr:MULTISPECIES: class I SAM-dependent RNA methyltransferase [Pontibacillus]MCD5322943.1 class I SAM-dependent RNA methyltransferase [Pontibacillus sp. HN14]WIF96337.1 class I SAM-dependent RNA methyltransferase [Pontibacillus chungwhensis]
MPKPKKITLIATTAMGLESIVAKEVKALGYEDVTVENGRVRYEADVAAIPRSNLWLRSADRVKLVIGEFEAKTFDNLFEQTKALPWEDYIPEDGSVPVIGKSVKSTLYSVRDCQSIVKKAIVERMRKMYGLASRIEESGPEHKVEIAIHKDQALLTLDTSGAGLHKRGYRTGQGEAPLKETMAAALVQLTNWHPNEPFVDPFCGSGTIPIEAALIGQNIAPGFNREFASESWDFIPYSLWEKAFNEAEEAANYDQELNITGLDVDGRMIETAKANAIEAGLGDLISWKQMQVKDFKPKEKNGYVVGNPPYGERLGDKEEVEQMYKDFGVIMRDHPSWSVYVITSNEKFEKLYGLPATKRRKLYNGYIKIDYYQYFGKKER